MMADENLAELVKVSLFGSFDDLHSDVFDERTSMELDLAFGPNGFEVSVPKLAGKSVHIGYDDLSDESLAALGGMHAAPDMN